jgi:DNA invertase Pin-like site-specific DNA recombinase
MLVGLVRVSSTDQNLDRQTDLMKSLNVEKVFADKASGKDTNRRGLQELLSFVREGDSVVVESISRLSRSTKDLLEIISTLDSKGVGFRSVKEALDTTTPQGRFVLTIFGALATLERESILQRQREGIDSAKARGKHLGRPALQKPAEWNHVFNIWKKGEVSAVDAMKRLNLSRSSFYKLAAKEEAS